MRRSHHRLCCRPGISRSRRHRLIARASLRLSQPEWKKSRISMRRRAPSRNSNSPPLPSCKALHRPDTRRSHRRPRLSASNTRPHRHRPIARASPPLSQPEWKKSRTSMRRRAPSRNSNSPPPPSCKALHRPDTRRSHRRPRLSASNTRPHHRHRPIAHASPPLSQPARKKKRPSLRGRAPPRSGNSQPPSRKTSDRPGSRRPHRRLRPGASTSSPSSRRKTPHQPAPRSLRRRWQPPRQRPRNTASHRQHRNSRTPPPLNRSARKTNSAPMPPGI